MQHRRKMRVRGPDAQSSEQNEFRNESSQWTAKMPCRNCKTKLAVRRVLAREPIRPSDLDSAERALARFAALAYVSDHPNIFVNGNTRDSGESLLSPTALPLVAE
jgi:hypothetical protein